MDPLEHVPSEWRLEFKRSVEYWVFYLGVAQAKTMGASFKFFEEICEAKIRPTGKGTFTIEVIWWCEEERASFTQAVYQQIGSYREEEFTLATAAYIAHSLHETDDLPDAFSFNLTPMKPV